MEKDDKSSQQVQEGSGENDPDATPGVAKPKGDPLSRIAAPTDQSEEEERAKVTEAMQERDTGDDAT